MKKVILIKYGELTTKKDNRNYFIKLLERNIKEKLINYEHSIVKDYYRMFIYVNDEYIDEVMVILSNIFGIHEIITAYEINDLSFENIKYKSLEVIKKDNFNTFKVETNRSDKEYPMKSMEISAGVGSYILRNISNIKVDVHNPEILLNIEIRREFAYIYKNGIKGLGGYPVGSQGKALLMLSGGIDSPVAGYLSMKRGIKLDYIYFESMPHTGIEARNKVIKLANIISKYGVKSNIYIVNFTKIQESIYKGNADDYLITIMRRAMYRISEMLAKKIKALAIINGESVGQVASQTLTSMQVVNEVTNFLVLRPLASFDKLEIIDISKKINTYETSILPYEDCCTVFVPKHPVINPSIEIVRKIEENLNLENLILEAVDSIQRINVEEVKDGLEYL